ncbi:MAG: amidohydrolase family protein [Blastochloris sp.]|nr:amidohydrolase family protein [Blastochloris sp.]
MLIHASHVLTMREGATSAPATLRIEGERITELAPYQGLEARSGEEVMTLDRHVLMPGLINAHCHLDYTGFKGSIFAGKGFTEWIKTINALKLSYTPDDYLAAIQSGFEQLKQSGCTTVLNIEAFPELLLRLGPPPIRTWWFLELIDLRNRIGQDDTLMGALTFFQGQPGWLGGFGLSPHAPYTSSVELYRLAKHCSDELGLPITTHIAESVEEQEMFLYGEGPMYNFLQSIGRDMQDCGQGSALSHLMEFGLLSGKCLSVHMNYLQHYDFQALRENPLNVVHCPGCHAYFGHARFPLEQLREAGCRISIGTDSLASNDTLDLRKEIRRARLNYPEVSAREWLHMVTTAPAQALGMESELGVIAPGALADLIAFPLPERTDPFEAVIQSQEAPVLFMVNGGCGS